MGEEAQKRKKFAQSYMTHKGQSPNLNEGSLIPFRDVRIRPQCPLITSGWKRPMLNLKWGGAWRVIYVCLPALPVPPYVEDNLKALPLPRFWVNWEKEGCRVSGSIWFCQGSILVSLISETVHIQDKEFPGTHLINSSRTPLGTGNWEDLTLHQTAFPRMRCNC